jgi:stage II sporulation protein AB (anti-sigma F factor)
MGYINKMNLKFSAINENEGFARLAVASFCSSVVKDLETISDIKTAVSEAVTNAIVHGYNNQNIGEVEIVCGLSDVEVSIEVVDNGVGIANIEEARKPFFTSKPELERSGMGFTVMEGFMDKIEIESTKDKGTKVTLIKYLNK